QHLKTLRNGAGSLSNKDDITLTMEQLALPGYRSDHIKISSCLHGPAVHLPIPTDGLAATPAHPHSSSPAVIDFKLGHLQNIPEAHNSENIIHPVAIGAENIGHKHLWDHLN